MICSLKGTAALQRLTKHCRSGRFTTWDHISCDAPRESWVSPETVFLPQGSSATSFVCGSRLEREAPVLTHLWRMKKWRCVTFSVVRLDLAEISAKKLKTYLLTVRFFTHISTQKVVYRYITRRLQTSSFPNKVIFSSTAVGYAAGDRRKPSMHTCLFLFPKCRHTH